MKSFFNRHEEEMDEMLEDDDLDLIDLDDTAEWSRLEVAEALVEQQAEHLMEETVTDGVAKGENDIEYITEDEEDDIEYLNEDDEDDIEYLNDDDEEEEEEEYEEISPFAFFENIGEWFGRWTVLDKVVAVTGVLVLAVAILTVSVFAGNRGLDKQMEAFAPLGEQLETVGVVGSDKLLAVAESKKALLEATQLEAELNQQYE